jgi:ElaB/YqjD/DUF883 family membrane-anchored ribosome-binding protein
MERDLSGTDVRERLARLLAVLDTVLRDLTMAQADARAQARATEALHRELTEYRAHSSATHIAMQRAIDAATSERDELRRQLNELQRAHAESVGGRRAVAESRDWLRTLTPWLLAAASAAVGVLGSRLLP